MMATAFTRAATADPTGSFRRDVLLGLSHSHKRIPPKYFYDEAGSRLFDRIAELDEYYPTITELRILGRHAGDMARHCGPECLLIELGAGSLNKVRDLLDQLERPAGFVPVDVSEEHLQNAAVNLAREYPQLPVFPICADFTSPFPVPDFQAERRVVFFPGSTIGNFDPGDSELLLRHIAKIVGVGGGLILGVDLRKDPAVLEAAYNDSSGVTAAFNKNLLTRMNRELGADFELSRFRHHAFYNRDRFRIEMHLVSTIDQRVAVAGAEFRFRAGESIHTENSYKFDIAELTHFAKAVGFRTDEVWTDPRGYFAMLYSTAV